MKSVVRAFGWGAAALALITASSVHAAEPPEEAPATTAVAPVAAPTSHRDGAAHKKIKKLEGELRDLKLRLAEMDKEAHADDKLAFGTYRLSKDLFLDFHGYMRARYVSASNIPVGRLDDTGTLASQPHTGRDDASDMHLVFSRLRLDPTLRWGGNPAKGQVAAVALGAQIDILDNVVWGDNSRVGSVPLFAENPSATNIYGRDNPPIHIRRLWLDVQVPVGLMKIGRQASQGGLGLLFNDGNGFRNDFGDAQGGSTFDRVAFATRPLTIYNALTNGSRAPTPLIVVVGHDWLVEDSLGFGSNGQSTDTRMRGGPFGFTTDPTCGGATDPNGGEPTKKCDNDVGQWLYALIWKDDKLHLTKKTDELLLGLVYVNRTQDFNKSNMNILDGFWRFRVGLSKTGPSIYTEGEFTSITGKTNGLKLLPGGSFNEDTGLADNYLEGGVMNFVGRLGLTAPTWDGILEMGYSSGDEQLIGGDQVFKMYPVNDDYKMGLLMYPMVLWARSVNTNAGRASGALNSGGGIFNSTYLNPKVRYRINGVGTQIELVAQGILAWADTLNGGSVIGFTSDYYSPRAKPPAGGWTNPFDKEPFENNTCSMFDTDCNIGWEADLAIKIKWLRRDLGATDSRDNYMMRWSNEFGIMGAGAALKDRLAVGADTIWTWQSRIAFVW